MTYYDWLWWNRILTALSNSSWVYSYNNSSVYATILHIYQLYIYIRWNILFFWMLFINRIDSYDDNRLWIIYIYKTDILIKILVGRSMNQSTHWLELIQYILLPLVQYDIIIFLFIVLIVVLKHFILEETIICINENGLTYMGSSGSLPSVQEHSSSSEQ